MTVLEILLPLVAVVLLTLPLIKVFTGKVSAQSAKRRYQWFRWCSRFMFISCYVKFKCICSR